ncbi:hypothetical protein V5O48_006939 [Marasmius crinis-equi]|uniref:MIT domain-containing protein n=1 Tax=Marasmius crinis-equi TaxID=585013 RepID=A0ABR3FI64_9AGAR
MEGSSSSSSSTSNSHRRRSTAAQTRPPPPPPNLPIPDIPQVDHDNMYNSYHDLSDPPPPSILPTSSRIHDPQRSQPAQSPPPQPHLLAPPSDQPAPRPPSSRRALTRALELARQAVQLDSTNDNPELAVQAYAKSVALLSEVMERVKRGEDSTEVSSRRRNGRRRSVVAQEEEVRRLQTIHDTYADRMNILSIIYSIPPIPYSSITIYREAFDNQELAQTASPIPDDSDLHDTNNHHTPTEDYPYHPYGHERPDDGHAAIGSAMFFDDPPSPIRSDIPGLPPQPSVHPYATAQQYDARPASQAVPNQPPTSHPPITSPSSPSNRGISSSRRSRAFSAALPPALPPPPISPPPPPAPIAYEPEPSSQQNRHSEIINNRTRGDSTATGHKRTGSGSKLPALEEDEERSYEEQHREPIQHPSSYPVSKKSTDPSRVANYDSPPLPSLPSPTGDSHRTSKLPPSPRLLNTRPRISSQVSVRSDGSSQMINSTTNQGTIFQRRTTTKTSAPPTPRSSSPAESTASASSIPPVPRTLASSLPGGSTTSISSSGGRSRSSSQPGRRPSTSVNSSVEQLPPLPTPTNGATARKTSYTTTSKLKSNAGLPLTVQTDIPAPNGFPSAIGPLTIMATGIPITPTSPLPPAAPADPSRKPYHLMNLLRTTMISSTGGYITRRLHVPQEVWSQGGAKLGNLMEKVRVVAILCTALEELQASSSEYFGAGNVSSGMAMGIGSIGKREGEVWLGKLEDFSSVCDGVVANFGKKLGVGEGFAVKKTTWGDKLGRRFDKFTNGKNLDSPAEYVQGLKRLFLHAQLLDEHTKAVTSQPIAPSYSGFPMEIRSAAEIKLRRASEFFASVVLTFVIRDLSQLLDKYAKKCEKWLAE